MHKLLIAEGNEEYRLALTEALGSRYRILCCESGKEALELLRRESPDLVVMDVMLTELDGITMLERAAKEGLSPRVLLTTSFLTDYVLLSAERLGICYVLRKPCSMEALTARIQDICTNPPAPSRTRDPKHLAQEYLLRLGLSPKHDGFHYLLVSILMMLEQPELQITKTIYPAVAKQFSREKRHVERSIRSALEAGWKHGDSAVWQQYFPRSTARPTNAVFVSRISAFIRQETE